MYNVNDIRLLLAQKFDNNDFVIDKSGVKTVELIGTSFIANEPTIFGALNNDYIERELKWYNSQSLNVNDIPAPVPVIWKQVADSLGFINSNYGWAIYSAENGNQYDNCVKHIIENPDTRRASMIYTRPSMHMDYNHNGRSDFMCTHAVNYLVRDNKIDAVVQMRSNDAIFGYRNDYAWQKHVLEKLAKDTNKEVGNIFWNAASLHIYERHFDMIDNYLITGEITK